jgi:hypothetical protein
LAIRTDSTPSDRYSEIKLDSFIFIDIVPDIDDSITSDGDAIGFISDIGYDLVDRDENLRVGIRIIILLTFETNDGVSILDVVIIVTSEF